MLETVAIAAVCSWANPGAAPYRRGPATNTVAAAVARYGFPLDVQVELVRKERRIEQDAVVTITKQGMYAPNGTATNLRDMHWRNGLCRGTVDISKWAEGHSETALVYCVREHCIAVPIVCGNVSRIDFKPHPPKEPLFRAWEKPEHETPPWLKKVPPHRGTIPEPSTLLLVGAAVLAAGVMARLRRFK